MIQLTFSASSIRSPYRDHPDFLLAQKIAVEQLVATKMQQIKAIQTFRLYRHTLKKAVKLDTYRDYKCLAPRSVFIVKYKHWQKLLPEWVQLKQKVNQAKQSFIEAWRHCLSLGVTTRQMALLIPHVKPNELGFDFETPLMTEAKQRLYSPVTRLRKEQDGGNDTRPRQTVV